MLIEWENEALYINLESIQFIMKGKDGEYHIYFRDMSYSLDVSTEVFEQIKTRLGEQNNGVSDVSAVSGSS